jgi:hypothetical protein
MSDRVLTQHTTGRIEENHDNVSQSNRQKEIRSVPGRFPNENQELGAKFTGKIIRTFYMLSVKCTTKSSLAITSIDRDLKCEQSAYDVTLLLFRLSFILPRIS